MLRHTTTIILFLAFALQTFQRTLMVADYYANTGSFAKSCENKFRPQMHCNGQCVLMKKIKEQEAKDQQNPERKQENKSEVIAYGHDFASLQNSSWQPVSSNFPAIGGAATRKMPRSFFHPPDAC